MEIAIYQVNTKRDHNRVAFQSLDSLKRFQGSSEIDSEIYDKVFAGEVNCKNLEDVYRMFNLDHPKGYKGRSLSVSDVIEVVGADGESSFSFCDSFGFKEVGFDIDLAEELKEEKIKVVLCEPGKPARTTEIDNSLEKLQAIVKGDIEAIYPFNEVVCIVCNDEGKFNGMEPNRALYGEDHKIVDMIFGPFFICDCSGQNFGSLNDEQLARYNKQFEHPEMLLCINGKNMVVPYPTSQDHKKEVEPFSFSKDKSHEITY